MGKVNQENEIVHLLGYITVEEWANSLNSVFGLNKQIIYELMRIQEEVYDLDLIRDVETLVLEKEGKRRKKY